MRPAQLFFCLASAMLLPPFPAPASDYPPLIIDMHLQALPLGEAQTRDVLYFNAARFVRLSEAEIASHHGRAPL